MPKSIEKACKFIKSAGKAGLKLVLFPEIRGDGGDLRPIMECAKEARINVALPINERMWWSFGDGSDLVVADLPEVGRVCGLLCWENYMTLARYTMMAQGCEFWMAPTQDIGNHWAASMQGIAREARAFVLTIGQMLRPPVAAASPIGNVSVPGMLVSWSQNMLNSFKMVQSIGVGEYMMDGGGMIANPEGVAIAGPVYSSCNYCMKDNYTYSVEWAKDGCPFPYRGPEAAGVAPCTFVRVEGVDTDREFVLGNLVSRGEVFRKKLYQDAVGNYARPDIWSVTWHNAPRDIMFSDLPVTTDGLRGYDTAGTPQFDAQGDADPNGPIKLDGDTEL
ncbi:hypothetical protein HYH03_018530 [Edaphochlamys debaryana]|uniref:CN hydrolase domain-containing protein n=1 Tax=Edaphochlamys debaryana TaxID=47281 RepID=A0A835XLR5_9CHLO|nr:hypothetical protein HYH03_018530 [Edaphochlamys debaryana]|eukprot:KAG2482539.1 hypothetical protein HYH03_018530 [Edaphochlamys debaryana]